MQPMKGSYLLLCALVVAGTAFAQGQASGPGRATASVQGRVAKDPGGEPVKKALIEMIAENQNEGGDYTAVTGGDGSFRVEGVAPGR